LRKESRSLPGRLGHLMLDAPVLIAQPNLEVLDHLAQAAKAEMAGLDNACVNRPNRYLVDPFPFNLEEFVIAAGWSVFVDESPDRDPHVFKLQPRSRFNRAAIHRASP